MFGRRDDDSEKMRSIPVETGSGAFEVRVPEGHAEEVADLISYAQKVRGGLAEDPAHVAASIVGGMSEDAANNFALTMYRYVEATGDIGSVIRGFALFMVARRAVTSDLAVLMLWMVNEGHVSATELEDLGLRPGALEALQDMFETLPSQSGASDYAYELSVRGVIRRLEQQVADIAAADYPHAGSEDLWRLRQLLAEFAQEHGLNSLSVAHRLLRAERPEALEFLQSGSSSKG